MQSLIDFTIEELEKFIDAHRVEFAKKSYPTKTKVLGVTVPNVKVVLKEIKRLTKSFSSREKIDFAIKLVETHIFECQYLAYEYLGKDKKTLSALTLLDIEKLGANLDNWVSVDNYSVYIIGFAWNNNIINTEHIKAYLTSEDYWQRRIAVVATVCLNKKTYGGKGNPALTLEICSLVVNDHEEMVTKALSWTLRELSEVNKESVIEFIDKNKDKLHSRVLREVNNKLVKGTKN